MKKSFHRILKWVLPMVVLALGTPEAQAQRDLGEFIRTGKTDANILLKAYLDPAGKAFGHGLNGGWFNSGKAMGLGRFDLRIFATATFAPEDAKSFDVAKLGLSNQVRYDQSRSTIAPTVFGKDQEGPELTLYAKSRDPLTGIERNEEVGTFRTPPGAGYDVLPLPMAQISVGLIMDTEIAVRFVPTQKFEEFEGGLWGIGIKHGIKQWIPVVSSIPGFDITVFGGYTNLTSSYGLDVPLSDEDQIYASSQQRSANYYSGQAVQFNTKALTASLVASKTFSVITGYAGVRYSNVQTELKAVGRYPVPAYRTQAPYQRYVEDLQDPIDVQMPDTQFGLTGGLRLKLLFFSMYGEYTLAKFPTATAGIGFGWN